MLAIALWTSAACAASDAWAGKTVILLVGQPAGGGYDGYSRLFAKYLPFLPGKPRIVVENMPGAGGVTMADYLSNEAPKDGTAIGLASGRIGNASARSAENPDRLRSHEMHFGEAPTCRPPR
jgi:tripartite-type tricarboxylate transporter receptor subunit TctC